MLRYILLGEGCQLIVTPIPELARAIPDRSRSNYYPVVWMRFSNASQARRDYGLVVSTFVEPVAKNDQFRERRGP